ncbi:MAG: hypothetical protein WA987_08675 [Cellvibrio sp.]
MKYAAFALLAMTALPALSVEDRIELKTTRIKGNQELPQILYVVPWKDMESSKDAEQKLVLHDFFGDLYNPMTPTELEQKLNNRDD